MSAGLPAVMHHSERIPTVNECARALLPHLRLLRNSGWRGLSQRDRDEATNWTYDLELALSREGGA